YYDLLIGKRSAVLLFGLFCTLCGQGFAQSFGAVTNDKQDAEITIDEERGFNAQVDIDLDLFRFTATRYSDVTDRHPLSRRYDTDILNNPFAGGFDIFNDTSVTFGYNGSWYGGKLSLNKDGLGGVKVWIGFFGNKLKLTAGNDIGYSYADAQGADAGLRVYDDNVRVNKEDGYSSANWESIDSNKNPDNITQDKGLLVEIDLNPLKLAFAAGGNPLDLAKDIGAVARATNNEPVYGFNFQYGANAGYRFGDYAKINLAYILQGKKDETLYEYNDAADKIVPTGPDAEIWNHLFGAYAGVYPFGNDKLGITAGYAGVLIKYLDSFGQRDSATAIPYILKNGVNLTSRYKAGEKLTIKTDHNFSFWTDKNYKIFYLYKPDKSWQKDYGLLSKSDPSANISDITHWFLWNGIGASYRFTDLLEGSAYARNLLRVDETDEYSVTNTYFFLELKSIFHFGPKIEAYASLVYNLTARIANEGLARGTGEFGVNPPKETADFVNVIQIPIGLTVKF
ncbi:MAG: hypothetical protein LBG87_07245, partial [Spirochaetaceae bacterium]|nr:hypothetical protein [Spirochaetaceae bacterium]